MLFSRPAILAFSEFEAELGKPITDACLPVADAAVR